MLLQKYKPAGMSSILANNRAAYEIVSFVNSWEKSRIREAKPFGGDGFAIITGPPGCGKTLALELAARDLKCELVEGSVEDVGRASKEMSLLGRKKILAVNLDDFHETSQNRYLENIQKLAEKTRWPLFFVTTDIYQEHLWKFRKMFPGMKAIRFFPPFESVIMQFLESVCKKEGIPYEKEGLKIIAEHSDGDIRFALLAVESMPKITVYYANTISRDSMHNIYTTLDGVFSGRGISEENEGENILNIIAENIPEVYSGKELVHAYSCVAAAEWFSRKTRHHMDCLKALPKAVPKRRSYNFPRKQKDDFPKEVAQSLHCSTKKAVAYRKVLEKVGAI